MTNTDQSSSTSVLQTASVASMPETGKSDTIPTVSPKEKKEDIIAKFKELQQKYEKKVSGAKGREIGRKAIEESVVLERAQSFSVSDIARESVLLEDHCRTAISELRQALEKHAKNLAELREAISISEKRLKEVHDIEASAGTLADLLETHDERKTAFEEEIAQKREEWKREQEEYAYRTKMDRAKEEDSYERKRQELERELTERRNALAREEEETAALRDRANRFDAELSEAVAKARMEAESRVRGEETAKAALLAEQVKRETGILEYRTESLTRENESLRSELASLKKELREAYDASKGVALKVIEGVAGERSLRDVSRIAMEQARGAGKREE